MKVPIEAAKQNEGTPRGCQKKKMRVLPRLLSNTAICWKKSLCCIGEYPHIFLQVTGLNRSGLGRILYGLVTSASGFCEVSVSFCPHVTVVNGFLVLLKLWMFLNLFSCIFFFGSRNGTKGYFIAVELFDYFVISHQNLTFS